MIREMRLFTAACAVVTCIALAQPSFAANEVTVGIDNFAFTPAELTVKAGTKIVFVNHDDIPHSIVGDSVKFRSKALDTDQSFAISFDKPGEIVYFCGLHPHMKGKITVTP